MATTGRSPGDLQVQVRGFQSALVELVSLVQAMDRSVARAHGVSATQWHALRLLGEAAPLTVNDLASRLHLDKSTASRVAAGLETRGHLTRTRGADDGRVVWLEATPAGHRARVLLEEERAVRCAAVLSGFDPEVRAVLTRVLSRLVGSFRGSAATAGPTDSAPR